MSKNFQWDINNDFDKKKILKFFEFKMDFYCLKSLPILQINNNRKNSWTYSKHGPNETFQIDDFNRFMVFLRYIN